MVKVGATLIFLFNPTFLFAQLCNDRNRNRNRNHEMRRLSLICDEFDVKKCCIVCKRICPRVLKYKDNIQIKDDN